MRPLSRYLLRRHVVPFCLAFGGLTGFMLVNQLNKQAPRVFGKGLPGSEIVQVFALSVPFIVAVVLPLAVLVAVLRVFTRLAADPEIVAMATGGGRVGVMPLIAPVLGAAACVALLAFLMSDQVLPRTNHRLRTLQVAIERPSSPAPESYKSDREMTTSELRQAARSAREEADRAGADGRQAIELAARQRAAAFEVEIQKKYALSAACLVFAFFGASVGLRFQRRGVALVIGVSSGVFVLFYVTLIGGEELGDRLIESPFVAMWTANLVLGAIGLLVLWRVMQRGWSVRA